MGFKVELKNADLVCLTLENTKDVKASFMQAVESALKRRVIKFEMDLGRETACLSEFYVQLIALQKVLSKRGERISIRAQNSIPSEIQNAFDQAGVELKIDQIIQNLKPHSPVAHSAFEQASIGQISFAEIYEQARLQNWPQIDSLFLDVYQSLKALIDEERALQKELEFYKKRIILLRPLMSEKLNLQQLQAKALSQEEPLQNKKARVQQIQAQCQSLSTDLQTKQTKYRNLIQKLAPDQRKKFEESLNS
jgi:hypothetical protein